MRRIVLVTGASSGIGRACLIQLSERQHRVYGTARAPDAASTDAPPPAGAELIAMDVTDDASVAAAVRTVVDREGRLDVVINCAGVGLAGPLEESSPQEIADQFETNVFGVARVCRAALPVMRAQQAGHIITVGSLGGVFGLPFQSLYSSSKFALEGLMEALYHEVRPFGVRVSLIQPGNFNTRFTDRRRISAGTTPESAYWSAFQGALAVAERDERAAPPPLAVAHLVARIVETPAPRLRYSVGSWRERMVVPFKRILPERIFLASVKRFVGLDR